MFNKLKKYFLPFLVMIVILSLTIIGYLPDGKLRVKALDIGQGDSFLIISPTGNQILIDGGPNAKVLEGLGKYLPSYDKKIELLILTHPQADHMAGLIEVLKRYEVEKVLTINVSYQSALFREFVKLLKEKKIEVISAQLGQVIELGGGAKFIVVYPEKDLNGRLVSDKEVNDLSINGKLVFGNFSIFFTADGEKKEELALMHSNLNLKSDILKIAHHGSKTSSHIGFLKSVNPQLAIISAGRDNKFGHPHQTVLDNLASLGIKVLRTDILGDINLISNGETFSVE